MAPLIFLASLLVVVLGNVLLLRSLAHVRSWSRRRMTQCLVLVLPLLTLGIGVSELCFHNATVSWTMLVSLTPVLLSLLIAVGAFLFGGMRLALMTRFLARYQGQNDAKLQELSQPLIQKLNLSPVRIRYCVAHRPLALTWGLFRPTILLSSWMVEHLDPQELQHAAQRDCLIIWLTTMLRDAFFYLPTSRRAYRSLQGEKELACDDLVVSVTRRPLALASALTKVWLYALEHGKPAPLAGIQALEGGNISLHTRIERLRHRSTSMRSESSVGNLPEHTATSLFLLLQMIGLFLLLASLGCGTIPLLPGSF